MNPKWSFVTVFRSRADQITIDVFFHRSTCFLYETDLVFDFMNALGEYKINNYIIYNITFSYLPNTIVLFKFYFNSKQRWAWQRRTFFRRRKTAYRYLELYVYTAANKVYSPPPKMYLVIDIILKIQSESDLTFNSTKKNIINV